jgi:hypothetical protein
MWNARSGTATQIIEDHEDGPLLRGGKTIVVDPPDGKIPYQPWALAERDSRRRPEMNYHDPDTHCFPAGVPRITYDMQPTTLIMQPPGYVVMLYEQPTHIFRTIPLDGRPHLRSSMRLWMGDSVGRWEGDTLVVETTNNNGKNWMAQYGDFISADARVVERYSMVDADTINYRATIEDPKVFARPWTIGFPLGRSTETYLLETACVEDNLDPQHMRPHDLPLKK